jgi:hypothetical protein
MYLEIDHARVLAILRDDLDDLVGFAVALGRVADPG